MTPFLLRSGWMAGEACNVQAVCARVSKPSGEGEVADVGGAARAEAHGQRRSSTYIVSAACSDSYRGMAAGGLMTSPLSSLRASWSTP